LQTPFIMLANTAPVPITQVIEDVKSLLVGNSVNLPRKIERTAIEFQPTIAASIAGEYLLEINGQRLTLECNRNSIYVRSAEDEGSQQPLYFESSTVLFLQPNSEDSFLIYYDQGEPQLAVVGMGGAEFPMQRINKWDCYDEGK